MPGRRTTTSNGRSSHLGFATPKQAACIGVAHPKWDERPLLVVVRRPGMDVTRDALISWFDGKVARWWTPDDVVFADSLPVGGTGKIQKNRLRETYGQHRLPTAQETET